MTFTIPVHRFSIASAQLAGTLCEAIFYGIYLATCALCARSLLLTDGRWVRLHEVRWMMASFAIIFFIISTWDVAIGILHLFNAFIKAEDPNMEFHRVTDWINFVRYLDQELVALLADFILIYRCWIVYGRRWLVIAPSLILFLSIIGMVIRTIENEISRVIFHSSAETIHPWFTAMSGVTVVLNILTTGMLVWRIWSVEKEVDRYTNYPTGYSEHQPRPLKRVMRIIAESGMVYTVTMFAAFLVSASGSNAVYIFGGIIFQLAGIVFNVIFVRCTKKDSSEVRVGVVEPEIGQIIPTFLPMPETSVNREQL